MPHAPDAPLTRGVSVILCTRHRPASVARFLASLALQSLRPEDLLVIDASSDDATRAAVDDTAAQCIVAGRVRYWKVSGQVRGLTRQRNFGLRHVQTDLVAFFDDDVVLGSECLAVLERTHRESGGSVAGVGCVSENELTTTPAIWRLRRALGIVNTLDAGRYNRSGMAIPWTFADPGDRNREGDWLPGFGMMWKTSVARQVRFRESFAGYAQGEDLDFSLRARRHGALVLAGGARLQHLHAPSGRPDAYQLGFMELYNRYQIHRDATADDRWRSRLHFVYAWSLDTLLLLRGLRPSRAADTLRQVAGRAHAGCAACLGR